jgi:hypothetical protein
MERVVLNSSLFGVSALVIVVGILCIAFGIPAVFAKSDGEKDKVPPIITELRVESVTDSSAIVMWTTDEPADSGVSYGVDPKTNIKGPNDSALVLSHAIVLSELTNKTTYAFCAESGDEASNKAEACGVFTTATPLAPGPVGGGAGGEPIRPTLASVSGFAYPDATIRVALHALPFGDTFTKETTASPDGSFSASFEKFPQGFYAFTISASDRNGTNSARKGIQFEFLEGGPQLYKEKVLIPPTITLGRSVVTHGDDIAVSGSAVPNTGVLVQVGDVFYETKSDDSGAYSILINTAHLAPGKISIRVRSAMVSEFGYDYSLSKTTTLSSTSVPEADLNADGAVDIKDFSIFLANPADMNKDGNVDAADVSIFLRAFTFIQLSRP